MAHVTRITTLGSSIAPMLAGLNEAPDYMRHAVAYLARYTGGTYDNYRYHLNCWIQWCLEAGLDPIHDVQRMHVELYIRGLVDSGKYANSTIHCRMAPVSGYYDMAVLDDLRLKDPTRGVRLPKIQKTYKELFDRDDMKRLLRAARDVSPRHYALVGLLCHMGLRISEACSLDVENIYNVEEGFRVLRFIGKGNKPAAMPVPYILIPILEAQAGDRRHGPLLTKLDGGRLHRHTAASLVKVAAKRAGFPPGRVHPHLLRGACITLGIDSGLSIYEAQKMARHSDPRTTEGYDQRRHDFATSGTHTVSAKLAI